MTPEEEEHVRRALAALAGSEPTGPMPPEVAGRLDAVLDGLASGDPTGDPTDDPTGDQRRGDELAARRGRRWPKVLVAAAAVAVVAGGTATLAHRGSTGASDRSASSSRSGTATVAASPEATASNGAGPKPRSNGSRAESNGKALIGGARFRPPLSSARLLDDVQSLVDRGSVGDLAVSGAGAAAALAPCRVPRTSSGDSLVGVRLDGRRATLLLSRPVSGRRLARVYGCGDTAHPEAETTVRERLTSR